jgi:hypothetical protein
MPEPPHWSTGKDALQRLLASRRLGLISDFDGTLSHFVELPAAAAITPENARALDALVRGAWSWHSSPGGRRATSGRASRARA